jgi:hypothetical protein
MPEDLRLAADDLLVATDDMIWRYLSIFWIRDFPCSVRFLLPFVRASNPRAAMAATVVLQRIKDPDLRALALDLLSERPELAIRLLRRNYQTGNFQLIEHLLQTRPFDESALNRTSLNPAFFLLRKLAMRSRTPSADRGNHEGSETIAPMRAPERGRPIRPAAPIWGLEIC